MSNDRVFTGEEKVACILRENRLTLALCLLELIDVELRRRQGTGSDKITNIGVSAELFDPMRSQLAAVTEVTSGLLGSFQFMGFTVFPFINPMRDHEDSRAPGYILFPDYEQGRVYGL